MCDYSLHHVQSRPAKVGDKLTTRDFGLGTRGFAAPEDESVAVCVLPGTELSFAGGAALGRHAQQLFKGTLQNDMCRFECHFAIRR